MEIVSAQLVAVDPLADPQTLSITAMPGEDSNIGRRHFSTGEDTTISRRHARFTILAGHGPERLLVTNLSLVNGMFVNFVPLQQHRAQTLYDGDEIVFRCAFFWTLLILVFFRSPSNHGTD